MQKTTIFKMAFLIAALFVINGVIYPETASAQKAKEIYEWRVYKLSGDASVLDNYFKDVLIPAYNRKGISVGAFRLYKPEETELRYLLFAYPDLAVFKKVNEEIWNDKVFKSAAQPFFDASAPVPVFSEYETYLSEAFDVMPQMRIPDKSRGLFELRIYHSPNDEAFRRKVKMFNSGEIDIFDATGINSVNYGAIIAGPFMPALMYLTWYKDEPARNAAWKAFGEHPDWKALSADPQYANTVKVSRNRLLSPMDYSQY